MKFIMIFLLAIILISPPAKAGDARCPVSDVVMIEPEGYFSIGKALTCHSKQALDLLINNGFIERGRNYGESYLSSAITQGDLEAVKLFLSKGSALEEKNFKQETPLHVAIERRNEIIARYLIENGAEVNTRNIFSQTPLFAAVSTYGTTPEFIQYMLDKGADPKVIDYEGKTALDLTRIHIGHITAGRTTPEGKGYESRFTGIAALLEPLTPKSEYKGKPVFTDQQKAIYNAAVSREGFEVDSAVLNDQDVNFVDEYGRTPLNKAAWGGNVAAIEALLKYGANARTKDNQGQTALHNAAGGNGKNQAEILEMLMDAGADKDIEAKTIEGHTPLLFSVRHRKPTAAEYLLNHGANIKIQDSQGLTVLDYAASLKNKEIFEILLAHGADINSVNGIGYSPLHTALMNPGRSYKDFIQFLLGKGADAKAVTANGDTTLHLASMYGTSDVIKTFKDSGVALGMKNKQGLTALDIAKLKRSLLTIYDENNPQKIAEAEEVIQMLQ